MSEDTSTPPAAVGTALPTPSGFVRDTFHRTWLLDVARPVVWDWLCDPATFTDTQVPPWRVEFVDPTTGGPAGFEPGVLTAHHGPLLHLPGVLGDQRPGTYRDLAYTYGAYVGSLRLARPLRLQFFLADVADGGTSLRLQVDADVRRWFAPAWRLGNRVFWGRFGAWAARGAQRRA